MVLDIGQRKPKNGSTDEKLRFWQATPDKDVPPSLKEGVELEEEVSEKDYDSLKRGDIITIEYKGAMSSGKSSFKVTAKNIVGKAKVGKVTLQSTKNPRGVKHFLYKRGNKVSFAQGDMAASVVKYTVEEIEEGWKKGKYTIKDNKGNILGTYNSGGKAQKAMDDLMQKGDYDKLTVALVGSKSIWKNEEVEIKEEVADITIQKDVGKMKINQVALKVMTNARRFGLKASLNGNYVRISGPKKKVNSYLDVTIGRSSTGDATQKGPSNPQIDRMLTKGLKKEEVEEGIDIEKASMGAVIKDFQNSDAPQFKGKSDKKRREMAIAAKLSKEENEDDDPVGKSKKNSKKDKVNLKPKMDETMKNYKEFMKNVKETRSQTQEKTGDEAEYQEKRKEVLKKFGVESCSQCETEKEKKACYKALDDAHVADHEEQVKKEEVEVSENTKEYKDVVSKILGRRKEVKEAVTTGGIEYGEQDWDVQHRLENSYPNLHANYAEFHEQGLEGPYLWHGETYFFDRKVGGWYSVTEEDFVDDEISKDLSLAYVKDGMYKRQFAS